ncbi:MAG: hypothetical protein LIO92_00040, partial [Clostridiales bacterium]|nr:hypothetical protein [Clostridiales bacterium]
MSESEERTCSHVLDERRMAIMNEVHDIMSESEERTCSHVLDERRMDRELCSRYNEIGGLMYEI